MWPFPCDLLMVILTEYFVQSVPQLSSLPKACVCVYNTSIQIKHACIHMRLQKHKHEHTHTQFFHNSVQKLF